MRRIIAAGLLMVAGPVWAADWQDLTGPEIATALGARVLQYKDGAMQNFFADGRSLYEAGAGESWGRWRVTGDQYCSVWPPSETWVCYDVQRLGLEIRFTGHSGDPVVGHYIDLQ